MARLQDAGLLDGIFISQPVQTLIWRMRLSQRLWCTDACLAHVEWAPVARLQEAGLLEAWGFLLQAPDFRLDTCDLMRLVAGRRLQKNQVDSWLSRGRGGWALLYTAAVAPQMQSTEGLCTLLALGFGG